MFGWFQKKETTIQPEALNLKKETISSQDCSLSSEHERNIYSEVINNLQNVMIGPIEDSTSSSDYPSRISKIVKYLDGVDYKHANPRFFGDRAVLKTSADMLLKTYKCFSPFVLFDVNLFDELDIVADTFLFNANKIAANVASTEEQMLESILEASLRNHKSMKEDMF